MKRFLLLVSSCLLLTGCVAPQLTETAANVTVNAQQSVITFYRPFSMMGLIERPVILEKTEDDIILLGTLDQNSKIQHPIAPGKHIFCLLTRDYSHILIANVLQGKSYYSYTAPRVGLVHWNFKLIPKRSYEVLESVVEVSKMKSFRLHASSVDWFNEHKQEITNTINSALENYNEDEDFTIYPEDGENLSLDPNIIVSH